MDTFDAIEVRRPALAASYLQLLAAQPGRPIALFAPRRVGKTFFLDHDLAPAAKKAGLLPVYADVWLHRAAPLDAINHALEEALDDATVPAGRVGRIAQTPVKKVGALGASIDLGEPPSRRALPDAAPLRLDALIARLAAQAGRQVLLMLDEIQTLGEVEGGEPIVAALRAVLHQRRNEVAAVFTGSSQDSLAMLMAVAGAPMYQFAQLITFPPLGDEYLTELAAHFARVHRGRKPALDDLRRVFESIGFKPALMKDLVKAMSAEGTTDVDLALKRFAADERQTTGWQALLRSLDPFDRGVLLMIAQGQPPLGRDTLAQLARLKGPPPTVARVRAALDRLKRAGILARAADGKPVVEDRLFAGYLAGLKLEQVE